MGSRPPPLRSRNRPADSKNIDDWRSVSFVSPEENEPKQAQYRAVTSPRRSEAATAFSIAVRPYARPSSKWLFQDSSWADVISALISRAEFPSCLATIRVRSSESLALWKSPWPNPRMLPRYAFSLQVSRESAGTSSKAFSTNPPVRRPYSLSCGA